MKILILATLLSSSVFAHAFTLSCDNLTVTLGSLEPLRIQQVTANEKHSLGAIKPVGDGRYIFYFVDAQGDNTFPEYTCALNPR